MFPDYKVRVLANACITRYDRGEKDINAVLNSYNISEENKNLIKAEIISMRPEIGWVEKEIVYDGVVSMSK